MPKDTSKKAAKPSDDTDSAPPIDPKYAPTVWGSGQVGGAEDLEVPSGQLCLVKRPGVQGLMAAGVLHQADSLSALVDQKHLKKGKPGEAAEVDPASLIKDGKALDNLMHVVDRVVSHVVVQPPIKMAPNDVTRRKAGQVYTDMVDLVDKMFIFNYAMGGTRDLERFRGELDESLGSVDAVEEVPQDSE